MKCPRCSDGFSPGEYVAETHRQREVFGPPPTPEQAIAGFLSELGYTVNAETRGAQIPVRTSHIPRQITTRFAAPSLQTQLVPIGLPPAARGCHALGRQTRIISQITR